MSTTTQGPAGRYRIAEVGRLTGFAPSTLRFYEQAGVLSPADRTPAGYRVYDDRDVERLRLIARAKDLGCTLDEIGDLVQAWDADECGPVKHRLRSLVDAKVAEVQRHITDQMALAAQLRATAAGLAGRSVDGPCDDSCGCTTAPGDTHDIAGGCGDDCGCSGSDAGAVAPAMLATRGPDDGTPPLTCSLGGGDVTARIDEWRTLLEDVHERHAIPGGLRLEFGAAAPLAEITRLATAEHDCCPFFAFAITVDGRGIALEVTAPPDGRVLVESVFGAVAT